ncbi:MAG TPA: TPM domain-containing protein, partial [Candidatus Sulfotelmatobacter sp.]|nr:TPM domain-containing protein [Candidatus Sulfotelmatobacter sp.]
MARLLATALGALAMLLAVVAPVVAAGPPFPAPTAGQYVYDTAGIFSAGTVQEVQATIAAIRQRTGAEIVVYTQVQPGVDEQRAKDDADALGNQWGVGQAGFDNGLVILFDLD